MDILACEKKVFLKRNAIYSYTQRRKNFVSCLDYSVVQKEAAIVEFLTIRKWISALNLKKDIDDDISTPNDDLLWYLVSHTEIRH